MVRCASVGKRVAMKRFFLYIAGFFLLYFPLSGCTFSLPKDVVPLDFIDPCPKWTLLELEKNIPFFDHNTDTTTLQCVLHQLRYSKRAFIHQTASVARICFLLADRTQADPIRRERFASEGVHWAEIALAESGQEDGEVYYYLAVNLGISVKEHMTLALQNLDRLLSSLEKAVDLSPDVNYAGPYRVLGMLYLKAPPWPLGIGDGDRALRLLNEALRRYPNHPKNQIFYAQALWEVEGEDRTEEAKKHLEQALMLMDQEYWKGARNRWIKDLNHVAKEAGIELTGFAEPE